MKKTIYLRFFIALVLVACLGVYGFSVIQEARNNVEQITKKEMPLLIAEKNVALALDKAQKAVQEYIVNGVEWDQQQWQKQKEIFAYYIETIEKAALSKEVTQLLEKNNDWLTFVENEILTSANVTEELKSSVVQAEEMQEEYNRRIAEQERLIETLEQEVFDAEKTSKLLLGSMTIILAGISISVIMILYKKVHMLKGVKAYSGAA